MPGLSASMTFVFRDTAIERAAKRKSRRVLFKTGGYGAKVMKRSMRPGPRKRKYFPVAGKPPRSWTKPGLRLVNFGVNLVNGEVAIGTLLFGTRKWSKWYRGERYRFRPVGKTVPQLVSEGGYAVEETEWESGFSVKQYRRYRAFPYDDLAAEPTLKFMQEKMESEPLK